VTALLLLLLLLLKLGQKHHHQFLTLIGCHTATSDVQSIHGVQKRLLFLMPQQLEELNVK